MNRIIYRLFILLNTEKEGSTSYNIAMTILNNLDILTVSRIQDIADLCKVSTATISRFFRELEFDDFLHYKDTLKADKGKVKDRYLNEYNSKLINNSMEYNQFFDFYLSNVTRELSYLLENIELSKIDRLVADIYSHNRVASFGLLHSQYLAMSFQAKLIKLNKVIISFQDPKEQYSYIHSAKKDDLIILFSLTGNYLLNTIFDEYEQNQYKKNSNARIILITSNRNFKHPDLVDDIIYVGHDIDVENYKFLNNHILNFIIDLIVYRYGYYLNNVINSK